MLFQHAFHLPAGEVPEGEVPEGDVPEGEVPEGELRRCWTATKAQCIFEGRPAPQMLTKSI